MPISLHAAVIPNWLQVLGAMDGLLGKAEAFVADGKAKEADLLDARLIEDMLPLAYQFKSCWGHTHLALKGAKAGQFGPDVSPWPTTISDLRGLIAEATATCEATGEDDLEAIAGDNVAFSMNGRVLMEFTVQDFLLSFSNPNVYFHSATAYDILRMRGVELGKRDFLGRMRIKSD